MYYRRRKNRWSIVHDLLNARGNIRFSCSLLEIPLSCRLSWIWLSQCLLKRQRSFAGHTVSFIKKQNLHFLYLISGDSRGGTKRAWYFLILGFVHGVWMGLADDVLEILVGFIFASVVKVMLCYICFTHPVNMEPTRRSKMSSADLSHYFYNTLSPVLGD